jgi:transposase-like protein
MLKGTLLQNNLFLTPQLVLMDFETAARNALKAVGPQMTLKACCFHFTYEVSSTYPCRVHSLEKISGQD